MPKTNPLERLVVATVVETDFEIGDTTLGDLLSKVESAIKEHGRDAVLKDTSGSYDHHEYSIIKDLPESDEVYEQRIAFLKQQAENRRKHDLKELKRLQTKLGIPPSSVQ